MDMKTTLPMMAKAALALLLAWGGMAQGGAQGCKRVITSADYETATNNKAAPDWVNDNTASSRNRKITVSYIRTINDNKCVQHRWGSKSSKDVLSAYKAIDFGSITVGSGCTDKSMKTSGYNIEFNFGIGESSMIDNSNPYTYRTQLVISSGEQDLAKNANYTGSDYIFALSSHETWEASGGLISLTNPHFHVNDLEYITISGGNKSEFMTNQNAYDGTDAGNNSRIDLSESSGSYSSGTFNWYHLKLVVTATSSAYTISSKDDNTIIKEGELKLNGLPTPVSVWVSCAKYCQVLFDNFEVYDYTSDQSSRTAEEPLINWKETTEEGKVYTISFEEGETLHYQLPGDSEWKEVSGVTSVEVTATKGGTLKAYTTYNETTSFTQLMKVPIYEPDISINADSYLCSFGSSNTVKVMDDDVDIYVANYENTTGVSTDVSNGTLTITKVNGSRIIPANNGVLLYKEGGGTVKLIGVEEEDLPDDFDQNIDGWYNAHNLFSSTGDEGVWLTGSGVYCLKKNTNELRRVQLGSGAKLPANKAYLRVSSSSSANLSLVFDDATGILSVMTFDDGQNAAGGSVKSQNALYNLAGQRVGESYKGIVVRNGKKQWKK